MPRDRSTGHSAPSGQIYQFPVFIYAPKRTFVYISDARTGWYSVTAIADNLRFAIKLNLKPLINFIVASGSGFKRLKNALII